MLSNLLVLLWKAEPHADLTLKMFVLKDGDANGVRK
jgi:hypothetical protein